LKEQNLVVGRNDEQLAQQAFGLGMDGDEFLAAVAHLHHRHAGSMPIEHFFRSLAQHRLGQRGGAGAEVEDTGHRVHTP
jgi:hypothetical protein